MLQQSPSEKLPIQNLAGNNLKYMYSKYPNISNIIPYHFGPNFAFYAVVS